jgi:hypothetical protein
MSRGYVAQLWIDTNKGIGVHGGGKTGNIFMKNNMNRRGNASYRRVVDVIPRGVKL